MIDAEMLPEHLRVALCASGYPDADDVAGLRDVPVLCHAASACPELVQELIDQGADVNAACRMDRRPPLMHAMFNPTTGFSVIEQLLRAGADPHAVDRHGYNVLGFALAHQNGPIAARLIKAGASVERCFPSSCEESPLTSAAKHAPEALALLAQAGQDMHLVDAQGRGAFHLLAAYGALDNMPVEKVVRTLDALRRQGVDVDGRDRHGNTPLHLSATVSPLLCEWLLHRGADVNASNHAGLTPLMLACLEHHAIATLLIRSGARVNAKSHRGVDALMGACGFPSSLFERRLMAVHRVGGCLRKQLPEDLLKTPCHREPRLPEIALFRTVIPTNLVCGTAVSTLLALGMNAKRRARDGSTALMRAARYQPESMGALIEHGAQVSARDRKGWTALMCAAGGTRPDLAVELLLHAGADPSEAFEKEAVAAQFRQHPRALALIQAALLERQTAVASQTGSRGRL